MRSRFPPLRCVAGSSLLEVLVTLAVSSALVAGGGVAMLDMGRSMRISAATHRLLSHLNLARSEAIKRNARVVVCKSADGASCTRSGGWHQGWIVFHDFNNNASRDAGEALVVRSEAGVHGDLRIVGNATVAHYVSFSPFGGTRHTSGAFQAGTITLCRQSLEPGDGRQLIINSVGRPRIRRVALASCV